MLTGAQNICLGHEPCRSGLIDGKGLNSLAEQIKHDLGLNVDLNTPVEQMGAGEQQLIEIMRALRTNPKILILDEPTASLGQGEIEPFLQFIQRIKSEREIAIIFISHKFEEVYEIADKIAVFTDGQNVLFAPSNELTQEMCIDAMLRQDKIKPLIISQTPTKDKQPLLEVEEIHYGEKYIIFQLKHTRVKSLDFMVSLELDERNACNACSAFDILKIFIIFSTVKKSPSRSHGR